METPRKHFEPEDIRAMRYLDECYKRSEAIRPQVEKLWEQICENLRNPWKL